MRFTRLSRKFYRRSTLAVARDLPGKYLVRRIKGSLLAARIVEVEAYRGSLDPVSHAYKGPTKRNSLMFGDGGFLYVYFTYGMHFCCNVVTETPGRGRAVLLRGAEPVRGIGKMSKLRGMKSKQGEIGIQGRRIQELCNGPAKICQAFGIGRKENGVDLCGTSIWLASDGSPAPRLARSSRIGIKHGREHQWRFYIPNHPCVSRGKPAS